MLLGKAALELLSIEAGSGSPPPTPPHSPPPSVPPPSPASPPVPSWWADVYNLQLYGYQGVASPHFADNTCGNLWLNLYNACPMGGIGKCVDGVGEWGATVDAMTSCGLQDDPVALPWPNASNDYNGHPFYANTTREEVVTDFCRCIGCAFLPAVHDVETPPHIPEQCEANTPNLTSVVETLARDLCGGVHPTSNYTCPGYRWPAATLCSPGELAECAEFEFTLGLSGAAGFDELARAHFLGRVASFADVPLDAVYMRGVTAGSVVATVGVLPSAQHAMERAVLPSRGGVGAGELSLFLGVPVQAVSEVGVHDSEEAAGAVGGTLAALAVLGGVAGAFFVQRSRRRRREALLREGLLFEADHLNRAGDGDQEEYVLHDVAGGGGGGRGRADDGL